MPQKPCLWLQTLWTPVYPLQNWVPLLGRREATKTGENGEDVAGSVCPISPWGEKQKE